MRVRQVAPVALVLGLTIAGFFGTRLLTERDARRDSERRAEVAAAQIRGRVEEASSLADSLDQFVSGHDVTIQQFEINALQWLSPAGLPAAGWVERVPASRRAAYERRTGRDIVTLDRLLRILPVGPRSTYLPATLISGIPPMNVPGLDLGSESGFAAALSRARARGNAAATPLAPLPDGTEGLFLIRPASRLTRGAVQPGFAVLFVSEPWLSEAATNTATLRLTTTDASRKEHDGAATARQTFWEAGQRFDVVVPQESVRGTAAALPWIIVATGLVLAALSGALAVNAARRARAQDELDRIFSLSPDLIAVANFEGHFTRVNPAAERLLGYTQEELLAHPYLDFVHPDDRGETATEAAALAQGKTTLSFENRYVCKDSSHRVLEWTSTPVVEDGLMYAVARDVTERRQAETELVRLAGEQAALRRVATLVAREASQAEVFSAIAKEIGQLLAVEEVEMVRFEDGCAVVVASWAGAGSVSAIGSRQRLDGDSAASQVFRTGRPARIDDYAIASGPSAEKVRSAGGRCVVGTPILVEGRLWGAMTAGGTRGEPLPPDTESRLGEFTGLMATAIANTETHARADGLAREQAALRRVATLVAHGAAPGAVFDAVAGEMDALLDADQVVLGRYEPDGEVTLVAHHGPNAQRLPPGPRVRYEHDGVMAMVRRAQRPARMDYSERTHGPVAEMIRPLGVRQSVGAPIVFDSRLWGVVVATWNGEESPAADTEQRMAQFAQLLETAIANADSRDQLRASRARIVASTDEARRKIERDLHDGAQQRLVTLSLQLRAAQAGVPPDLVELAAELDRVATGLNGALDELRELARGIHPPILTEGGLGPALKMLARRSAVPVELDVRTKGRLPQPIEVGAYYVVAEALTNAAKHAHARSLAVEVEAGDQVLRVLVRDDGVGGAEFARGSGLVGLRDRVEALRGRISLESPLGLGTSLSVELPLEEDGAAVTDR